jgi:uncharacterized membrane protein
VVALPEDTFIQKIFDAFFKQELPVDLVLVVVWLVVSIMVINFPFLNVNPVRIVLAIPIVLFIPGYCLITALFPKNNDIDILERVALSIGLSIVILPMIGFGLNFTPGGIRLNQIVFSLTLFTGVMILVAYYRRARLQSEARFRIPFNKIAVTIRKEIFPEDINKVNRFFSIVLSLAIIIAIITIVYLITVPREGDRSSEFYLLGEHKMAAGFPELIIPEQDYPIYIGVVNHEYRTMTYTIEIWNIHAEVDNVTNTSAITTMDFNEHLTLILTHNETKVIPYHLLVNQTGYNQIVFLLFNESVPGPDVTDSDRINASYRDLHLVITMS